MPTIVTEELSNPHCPTALRTLFATLAAAAIMVLSLPQAASAASLKTQLCVANMTDMDITKINVTSVDNYDWDGSSRPDKNFKGKTIAARDSRCEREELNTHANGAPFTMTLTFSNNTTLTFRANQKDAKTKYWRTVSASGSAANTLEIKQTAGADANGYYIRTKAAPDNSGWMAQLLRRKPDIRMNELTMPGSHDAGMSTTKKCTGGATSAWAITQHSSIGKQLTHGTRYFDLRPFLYSKDPDKIYLAHYSSLGGCYGQKLDDVLDEVKSFLRGAGRGEAVFLKVSHTQQDTHLKGDIRDDVTSLFESKLSGLLLTLEKGGNVDIGKTKLKTLAGKAIAVFDIADNYDDKAEKGILNYADCDTSGEHLCRLPKGFDWGLLVYDKYAKEADFDKMRDDQIKKLERRGGYGNQFLYLLSWTLTGTAGNLDIQALSARNNPQLPHYLAKIKHGDYTANDSRGNPQAGKPAIPEIVYIDFGDAWLNRLIIDINN
ncbi:hypothetical protein [Breoghania sp. L-A4]|uniref:hypothetical protein n=1 Tax=Breoghania sp. L-A4 TaxID=2304600 RepID=UPI000E35B5B8|nr:hypothetical protein [Breoghania sp. L-A4]AXS40503.1 hypothetical protein D1F64_11080 [Breoghania sp. L-A4]